MGVKTDNNGNVSPVRANGRAEKIDGFMSFLDAYTCYLNLDEGIKNIFIEYQSKFEEGE